MEVDGVWWKKIVYKTYKYQWYSCWWQRITSNIIETYSVVGLFDKIRVILSINTIHRWYRSILMFSFNPLNNGKKIAKKHKSILKSKDADKIRESIMVNNFDKIVRRTIYVFSLYQKFRFEWDLVILPPPKYVNTKGWNTSNTKNKKHGST